MTILSCRTGLTSASQSSLTLFVVNSARFDDFLAALDRPQHRWMETNHFSAKAGHYICLPDQDGQISCAAVMTETAAVWDIAAAAKGLPAGDWVPDMRFAEDAELADIQLGWGLAQYQFAPHKNTGDADRLPRLCLKDSDISTDSTALVLGTHIVREMVNRPANQMTPEGIETAARELAEACSAKISVVSGDALKSHAPALHIVGRAAETGPRMIELLWGTDGPAITLVGKGISFDSGGLDIKPSKAMELMKKDMGGAAHVLGIAAALMTAGVNCRLRVLIAAAENAISAQSMRPLDVIETAAGIDVEVGNTDAEGRLVLADALYHALHDEDHPEPDFLIDFATLTGAARVALGTECPALFCNRAETAQSLMNLGQELHDPVWQLPLFEAYDRYLDAGQAGLSSTGNAGGYGGAITAALFLRRFTGKDVNWAHIDVMAWNLSSRPGRPKGGEAMGLRTSFAFIKQMAEAAQ